MAANDDRTIQLQVTVDDASLGQVKASLTALQEGLVSLGGEAQTGTTLVKQLDDQIAQISRANEIDKVVQGFNTLRQQTGDTTTAVVGLQEALRQVGASKDEIDQATDAFNRMADAAAKAQAGEGGGGGGGIPILQAARGIHSTASLLSTNNPLSGGLDIAHIVHSMEAIGPALGPLEPLIPIITAEFAGFVGGLKLIQAEIKPTTDILDAAVKSLHLYYEEIQTGTTDTIEKKLSTLSDQIKAKQQELAQLSGLEGEKIDTSQSGLGVVQSEIHNALINMIDPSVKDRIVTLRKELTGLTSDYDAQERALNSTAVAQNDYLKGLDEFVAQTKSNAKLVETGSSKQIAADIGQLGIDANANKQAMDALQGTLKAGGITAEQAATEYNKLATTYNDDMKQIQNLQNVVLPLVQKREEETKIVDEQKKAFDELIKAGDAAKNGITQLNDNLAKFKQDTADINANRSEQLASEQQDYQTAQKQKAADFYDNLAQQDTDFYDNEAQKVQKLQEEAQQIFVKSQEEVSKSEDTFNLDQTRKAQDLAENIAKIERDSRISQMDAASHLDARKIAEEQRNEAKQIGDLERSAAKTKQRDNENEQIKIRDIEVQAQREHDLRLQQGEQQIKDEEAQHQRQKELAIKRFEEQEKRSDEQEKVKIEKQQEAWKKEDDARAKNFEDQQRKLADHLTATLYQQVAGQYALLGANQTFMTSLATIMDTGYAAIIQNLQAQSNAAAQQQQQTTTTTTTTSSQQSNSGSSGLDNWFGGLGGALGGLGGLLGFAPGGQPPINKAVWVGEKGPELAVFRSQAQVYNNRDSMAMAGVSKGATNIYINGGKVSGANKQLVRDALIEVLEEIG